LPPPRNPTPLQQPEYFKRESKSLEDIHLVYELSSEAKRKSNHWLMNADYPEHTHTALCRIYRVKIKPGMFKNESGNVVHGEKTPQQCIVYSLSEYIDSPEHGGVTGVEKISGDYYSDGIYLKHIGKFDHDKRGNVVNANHMGTRNMFYIPYSPEKIPGPITSMKRQYRPPE
jgi:hypothetical protein